MVCLIAIWQTYMVTWILFGRCFLNLMKPIFLDNKVYKAAFLGLYAPFKPFWGIRVPMQHEIFPHWLSLQSTLSQWMPESSNDLESKEKELRGGQTCCSPPSWLLQHLLRHPRPLQHSMRRQKALQLPRQMPSIYHLTLASAGEGGLLSLPQIQWSWRSCLQWSQVRWPRRTWLQWPESSSPGGPNSSGAKSGSPGWPDSGGPKSNGPGGPESGGPKSDGSGGSDSDGPGSSGPGGPSLV